VFDAREELIFHGLDPPEATEPALQDPSDQNSTILNPNTILTLDNPLIVGSSDTLSGSGQILGEVINHGVISPGNSPGIQNVASLTLAPDGTLEIEIGGLTPGPGTPEDNGYDQINVSGHVDIAGTLEIVLINDFDPALGNTFDFLTFGTRSGSFDHVFGQTGFGDGTLYFEIVEQSDRLQLVVREFPAAPDWVAQGPSPFHGGQVTGIPDQPVTGAIEAVAIDPRDLARMYVGTVGGGVWKNNDRTVLFEFDHFDLTTEAQAILDDYAAYLNNNPGLTVRMDGHTDSIGTDEYNETLGQNRADAVETYLIGQGVDAGRISTQTFQRVHARRAGPEPPRGADCRPLGAPDRLFPFPFHQRGRHRSYRRRWFSC
jgi:outer membrane protein OmpA-like peptidoglycan-associated protein